MRLLQNEMQEVNEAWNTHRIRPSAGARCPAGIPDELYFLPRQRAVDCKIRMNEGDIPQFIKEESKDISVQICEDNNYCAYLKHVCNRRGWSYPPANICDASTLYTTMRNVVKAIN
jgi:hypothetical protein